MSSSWPKPLQQAKGPFRRDKLEGAVEGMGDWGAHVHALAQENLVPPDIMTGLTLFILSHQPKDPSKQKIPGGGGGVAGGVWVRERFTIHRPLQWEDEFTVQGEAIGRHVHKGRRYGSNVSSTLNSSGELVGSNLTTGLLAYQVEEGLSDQVEGQNPDSVPGVGPDWSVAANNPCIDALRELNPGDSFGGHAVLVGLDLMEARDTNKPDNPIHSDPELAKKAGLKKPIAGGSHVLAFALEPIMEAAGTHALLHGAAFDIRWKAPVFADATIYPTANVTERNDRSVKFEVMARLEDDAVAMVGTVEIPLT